MRHHVGLQMLQKVHHNACLYPMTLTIKAKGGLEARREEGGARREEGGSSERVNEERSGMVRGGLIVYGPWTATELSM